MICFIFEATTAMAVGALSRTAVPATTALPLQTRTIFVTQAKIDDELMTMSIVDSKSHAHNEYWQKCFLLHWWHKSPARATHTHRRKINYPVNYIILSVSHASDDKTAENECFKILFGAIKIDKSNLTRNAKSFSKREFSFCCLSVSFVERAQSISPTKFDSARMMCCMSIKLLHLTLMCTCTHLDSAIHLFMFRRRLESD